jgi:hypothetical protein
MRARVHLRATWLHTHDVLDDEAWRDATLAKAKEEAQKDYPETLREEIRCLTWGARHTFYRYKGARRMLADLEGGKNYRAWRIECHEHECEGIGYDD